MNYIIIRPGIPVPTDAERKMILKISNGGPALGGPIIPDSMSGTFSIVSSDLTKEEIALLYQELSEETRESEDKDDHEMFPVMIFEVDNNFAYNKDLAEFIGYGHIITTNLGIEPTTSEVGGISIKSNISKLDINQLLDIMEEKGGFEKMSKQEQKRMQELSNKL